MSVMAQVQRLLQAAGKRPELAEMTDPCLVVQRGQPGFGRRPVVAKTQYMRGKARRLHGVVEIRAQRADELFRLKIGGHGVDARSEEHTSELQSLMRISYALFCLKKKKI